MPPAVRIPRTEVHRMRSRAVDDDFELWIAVPDRNPRMPTPERLPLLVVPDANLWFGVVTDLTRIMHMLFGELPPMLVLGIAYPGDDFAAHGEIRNRDLTPSADQDFEAMARSMDPSWTPRLPRDRRMGRAEAFLSFLVDEALPFVGERHAVAPGGRTLFGSSLAGLFTVWAFLTRPDAFSHHIASSPALWWDEEAIFDLLEHTGADRPPTTAGSGAPLPRGEISGTLPGTPSLFLGVGSLEEGVPGMPWLDRFRTVTNVRRLGDALGRPVGPPGVRYHVFEGETHTSVVPCTLTRGLRALHARGAAPADPKPPSSTSDP